MIGNSSELKKILENSKIYGGIEEDSSYLKRIQETLKIFKKILAKSR